MELEKFNPTNVKTVRTGKPTVRFAKSGQVSLNKFLVELLKIKEGDMVEFAQDKKAPEDWYIKKTKLDGFVVRNTGKKTIAFAFYASEMFKKIAACVGKTDEISVGFVVGTQPTEGWYPIFTSSPN